MIRSAGYFPAFNRYFLPAARKNNPQVIHKKTAYPPFFFTPFPEVHNKKNKHQLKTQKDTFELFSLHDENTKTAHHLHFAPAA
jgi:hypothetical protein